MIEVEGIKSLLVAGQGETIYTIMQDYSNKIKQLRQVADTLDATVTPLCVKGGEAAEVLIREVSEEKMY